MEGQTNATEPAAAAVEPNGATNAPQQTEPANEKQPDISRAFAVLARREKELRAREAALKEKEPVLSTYEQRQALKKENLLKYLEEEGLTYEDITRAHLNTLKPEEEKKLESLEARLQQLADEREREKKEREEREVQQQSERIETAKEFYKEEAIEFIKAHPEDYELIVATEAFDDVFSVVEKFFLETAQDPEKYPEGPVLLEPKVAADYVEKLLLETYEPLTKTKKLAPKASSGTPGAPEVKQDERVTSKPSPTINSGMVRSDVRQEPTSEHERLKRAAAKLRFVDSAS